MTKDLELCLEELAIKFEVEKGKIKELKKNEKVVIKI